MIERRRLLRVVVTVWALLLAASVGAQEVLTNDGVLAMKKAGLSDAVILAKIRSSQSKFDVSTEALVRLKQAGLSDPIIEAMLGHAGPAVSGPPPAAVGAVDPRSRGVLGIPQGRDGVFHVRGDQYVELAAAVASIETNFAFFQSKSEIVLKGRKATYRVADREPVFVSVWAPNEAPLVRLKPGDDHDDRNLKFSSGSFMPFGGTHKQGVRTQDTVDVESEKDPRGFYRVKPRQPLAPGEYGFVLTHGFAGGTSGKIYDFGVD
ncbi:MAG TPA: hypothetical protein VFV05_06945 [Methylomirabilota bacterium]|nr:hypothetical protein [Methylomirabilota bacterium]